MRAFGPIPDTKLGTGMFGYNDNSGGQVDVPAAERQTWRCDSAGAPPKGKLWQLTGMGISVANAVNRVKFKCRLFNAV